MPKKPDNFLKMPEYPGGKTALQKFIKEHVIYPEEAREAGVKGVVYLLAEIDDNGVVGEVKVSKGLGFGCDEEAIRVVKLMKFGSVSNRGRRLKTKKKFRIHFKPEKKCKVPQKYLTPCIKQNKNRRTTKS